MPAYYADAFTSMDATVLAAFGEECTYYPKVGDSRAVTAAVDAGEVIVESPEGIVTEKRLEVLVSRSAVSGIDDIQVGDGLRRDTDPAGEVHSYQGEKIEEHASYWKLAFVRRLPYERGGNRIR
jgi:hypothetical protein